MPVRGLPCGLRCAVHCCCALTTLHFRVFECARLLARLCALMVLPSCVLVAVANRECGCVVMCSGCSVIFERLRTAWRSKSTASWRRSWSSAAVQLATTRRATARREVARKAENGVMFTVYYMFVIASLTSLLSCGSSPAANSE